MPAPEYALRRYKRVRVNGDAPMPGGKQSSPRPLPLDRNPDGMEQETLRAPAASTGRGPQGKATVDSIVAGVS